MKNYKKRMIAVALLHLSPSYLFAEDINSRLTPSAWSGLYIGGQLGGAWANQPWEYTNFNYFNTTRTQFLGNNFDFNSENFIGGGYIGFNYPVTEQWLLGLEGSFSGVQLIQTHPGPFYATDQYTSSMNQIGTLKGRLGFAQQRWLPYVSGGWAYANTSLTVAAAPVFGVIATTRPWNSGWIAGAGIDYSVNAKLKLGVSYDYSAIYINNQTMSCPNCGSGAGHGTPLLDGTFKTQAVMARLTYWLNH